MRRYGIIGFIVLMAAFYASTALAAVGGIAGMGPINLSVNCNQVTIDFVFQNLGGYDFVFWSATVNGSSAGGGLLDGGGNLANSPTTTTRTVTLTQNAFPGDTLTVTLSAEPGADSQSATIVVKQPCAGGSSTATTEPVPPCKLNDGRLDASCGAPVATYVEEVDSACYINIYSGYGTNGGSARLVLAVPSGVIAAVAEKPAENTLLDSGVYEPLGRIAVYRLTTGEFQVNVGPYGASGQVYVLNFSGCGATEGYNTNSYQVEQP